MNKSQPIKNKEKLDRFKNFSIEEGKELFESAKGIWIDSIIEAL